MKLTILILLFIVFPIAAAISEEKTEEKNEIVKAIRYSYNFQFDKAGELIDQYISANPDDLEGLAGRIIYDFLVINQYPDKKNIEVILKHLDEYSEKIDLLLKQKDSIQNNFYRCFADYYYMKSYALNNEWISSFSHATKSKSAAEKLIVHIDKLPDLYFILGDQYYTASLLPDTMQPLLKAFSFNPDSESGLKYLELAMEKGVLTRQEAKIFYISSAIYIEKDYEKALSVTEEFLHNFPDNLTAVFYKIDILLRKKDTGQAKKMLDIIEKDISAGKVKGKWISRYQQMYGNWYNTNGDYKKAIEYYEKALKYGQISSYTYTEITLETGKLYDVLGDRGSARSWFWKCEKSKGLLIQREEAKIHRENTYKGSRGSY
ncbi:MAG: hypothetical protein RBT69_08620 [Spirochaetia bacterium]|jgi:tetratricopeptide (TPR) repeat protein|nr:hypothetical protein [Spirochaetia bacterium]